MNKLPQILENLNIELLTSYEFENNEDQIKFISKINKLKEKGVSFTKMNNELINLILKSDTGIKFPVFKKINFEEFFKMYSNINSKRDLEVYKDYVRFLKREFGILEKQVKKDLINLHSENKDLEDNELKSYHPESIYEKIENFNLEEDKFRKLKKFDIDLEFDYTKKSEKLSVTDFTLYFTKRLEYYQELLSSRIDSSKIVRISQLRKPTKSKHSVELNFYNTNTKVTFIGLVNEITITKNGHYILNIEDKSENINCFVNKTKTDMVELVKMLCLDEGIGIKGTCADEIIWIDEIILPTTSNNLEIKKTEEENYLAIISDVHVGANVFCDVAFFKLIEVLSGKNKNEKLKKIQKKIKYLLIAGDLIEGIGIYPNQGKDARILSTESQYRECARLFSKIPKDICIIIIPGNHDTARLSEPQPKLPYSKAYSLYNMENVVIFSNPSVFNLHKTKTNDGLNIMMYHGGSFIYYADKIQKLRDLGGLKNPNEVVKYLLDKKHLAPSHGSTLYIPDNQNDPLVIKKIPDIFICGHTHKHLVSNYKSTTIVSGGCWVEMSDYQEKVGMFPDIGKLTLINTKTRQPLIVDLYKEKHKR